MPGERSRGARGRRLRLSPEQFDGAVEEALARVPEDLLAEVDNLVFTVEEEPEAEDLVAVGLDPERDTLFGLYQGTPLPDRGPTLYGEQLPDRIVIYRAPLLRECTTRRELLAEIRDTVVHELGHYFGFDEEDLP